MMWHGTLSEMGIVVISSTLAVGAIADALDVNGVPIGPQAEALIRLVDRSRQSPTC